MSDGLRKDPLGRYAPLLAAFAGTLLTYSVSSSGLVFPAYLFDVQVGLLAGIAAGLLADGVLQAALAAAAGVFLGVALGVSSIPPDISALATLLAAAEACAAGVAWLRGAKSWGARAVMVLGVVMVVANLWATTLTLMPAPSSPHYAEASARPVAGRFASDDDMYREITWTMRDGAPYYQAVARSWTKLMWGAPRSLFDVRQPTLFRFWASLPGWPMSAVYVYLAFVTLAMAAAAVVASRTAPPYPGVAGAAAIGAYLFAFLVVRGDGVFVKPTFMAEPWVGTLSVLVAAAFLLSRDDRTHRRWMVAAAALAFVAMISRELMAYLMLAGLAGAVAAPARHRRFDLAVWAVAFAGAITYWGVHASKGRALISGAPRLGGFWLQNGGFDYLWRGVFQFTAYVSPQAFVAVALVVLGIVAALLQPDRQFRVFVSAAVLLPLVGFLFAGNTAHDSGSGALFNYWGPIVMPLIYALAPSALLLLPGLRRPAPAQATEDEAGGAEVERQAAGA